jgi:monoamine oxidase
MNSSDIIVVGAGLAGLTAALRVSDAGSTVTVLEACDRVGGRTESGRTADGQWIELGGQWVAPAHTELRRLLERFGIATAAFGTSGDTVSITGGRRTILGPSAATDSLLDSSDQADIALAVDRFADIVDAVDLAAPWRTPKAATLDEVTFAGWIDAQLPTDAARNYFRTACELLFAPHPHEVSLLHAAVYFKSGSHLGGLRDSSRDTQEERVVGGASTISDAMARHLGDRIRLGTPVRSINQSSNGVSVLARDGARYTANRVIVTMPPRVGRPAGLPADPAQRSRPAHPTPARDLGGEDVPEV